MSCLLNTYKRLPVAFSHGEGVWLWDVEGNRYLDGLSGIGVNALGHAHPALVNAISEQAKRFIHVSNYYQIQNQEAAAERITRLSGLDGVFFGNSGAEANEGLVKLSRLHAKNIGIDDPAVIVMSHAFHGRTMETLSATANVNAKKGFNPLPRGFIRVPFNDIAVLKQVVDANPNVVAVLMEVVQGEGGVIPADVTYVQEVRKLCDDRHLLMLLDEVQCGMGRTGKWFAYQHANILPDAISLSKSLGGGAPVGAFVVRKPYSEYFQPGSHGSTFGGNPLVTAAVVATFDTMEADDLVENAKERGEQMMEGLRRELADVPNIKDIRGKGLMIGVELDKPCPEVLTIALKHGVLLSVTAGNVVRLLPPLVINAEEAEELVKRVAAIIREFLQTA